MSKPLELTVYPRERQCACCGPIYTLPTGEVVTSYKADSAARQKRLSEAEVMAELHRAVSVEFAARVNPSGFKPGAQERAALQCMALHRFATLPHYDDDNEKES